MSGSLIGGVIGATIGFVVGGPTGAMYGFSLGSAAGGILMPGKLPDAQGPRLSDLRVQSSEYGRPIPIVYGTVGLQGNVIWAADLVEVKTDTTTGGKGGPSQTTSNYSYFGNFAVAICDGPIAGVLRIWAGPAKRLIYDGTQLEGGKLRIYLGDEEQLPDSLIEQNLGVGNVPAYRGTAYVVFEMFPLANDGNAIPFLTFEVSSAASGGVCGVDYTMIGSARLYDRPPVKVGQFTGWTGSAFNPVAVDNDGNIYVAYVVVPDGTSGHKWAIKKASSSAPIQESDLLLGSDFDNIYSAEIAYNPLTNQVGVIQQNTTNFRLIDCASFTFTPSDPFKIPKRDIIYHAASGGFRFLDAYTAYIDGVLSADCYGITGVRVTGQLFDCGQHGLVVSGQFGTYLNGARISSHVFDFYDPKRDRLVVVSDYVHGIGYYDFTTNTETYRVESPPQTRLYPIYSAQHDRIICQTVPGVQVMKPDDLTDDCLLFAAPLVYDDAGTPVHVGGAQFRVYPLPTATGKVAVVPSGSFSFGSSNDIFLFHIGANAQGVVLSSVASDLSDRAGMSSYDVSQLTDIVDGYVIARQTDVRSAIDALRPAYYFDAVESQGIVRFVKRGSTTVAVIADEDLAARSDGEQPGDPLTTVRKMEVELPRTINVNYMSAATDYEQASKTAKRLVGFSLDETTLEMPLVLSDTKAQEVADVNLHVAWAGRLTYAFSLPRKYSQLEPTDLVLVKGNLMRLTKVTATPAGVLKCEAISDDSTYYAPHVIVTETPPNEKTVFIPGATVLELM